MQKMKGSLNFLEYDCGESRVRELGNVRDGNDLIFVIGQMVQELEFEMIDPSVVVLKDDYYYLLVAYFQEFFSSPMMPEDYFRAIFGIDTVVHHKMILGVQVF